MSVSGYSQAGIETWFRVRPPDAAFDVGRGAPELTGVNRVFLTHGHLDHAAGLPLLLSQRSLQDLGETEVYCPSRICGPLESFVEAAACLENRDYSYALHGLWPGDRVQVAPDLAVEAFETSHGVPSLGYFLIRSVDRLKRDLIGVSPSRLEQLRRDGAEISEREERIWLAYPGDSTVAVFEREPRLFEARVLLVECTFLHAERRHKAKEHGHIHFEDLRALEKEFRNEVVVLHHQSRRFSSEELRQAVEEGMPKLAPRVHILGERQRPA